VAPCCGEVFGYRHCHNDAKVRPIDIDFRSVYLFIYPRRPNPAAFVAFVFELKGEIEL
jgi:hypothetical protein